MIFKIIVKNKLIVDFDHLVAGRVFSTVKLIIYVLVTFASFSLFPNTQFMKDCNTIFNIGDNRVYNQTIHCYGDLVDVNTFLGRTVIAE